MPGRLLEVQHSAAKTGMIRELDVQIRTMRIDQNAEDTIHGVVMHLHVWTQKWSAPNQVYQAIHEMYALTQYLYATRARRWPGIAIGEMNGANASYNNQFGQFSQDELASIGRNVLENNERVN